MAGALIRMADSFISAHGDIKRKECEARAPAPAKHRSSRGFLECSPAGATSTARAGTRGQRRPRWASSAALPPGEPAAAPRGRGCGASAAASSPTKRATMSGSYARRGQLADSPPGAAPRGGGPSSRGTTGRPSGSSLSQTHSATGRSPHAGSSSCSAKRRSRSRFVIQSATSAPGRHRRATGRRSICRGVSVLYAELRRALAFSLRRCMRGGAGGSELSPAAAVWEGMDACACASPGAGRARAVGTIATLLSRSRGGRRRTMADR